MNIRIATRKSALALWQARHVAALLAELPGVESTTLVPLSTRGDEILDRSLRKIGGKGLFIKELEVAMQDGRADLAVHSMKDVPVTMPEGFDIACLLPRAIPADALISQRGQSLATLPDGAVIGSSSLRRQAQLKLLRPDLRVRPLRGNVNTRLQKLDAGDYDAIVLAAAGLQRLGLQDRISEVFSASQMLPAAAQGVLGIECLDSASELHVLLEPLNDAATARTTAAERAVAARLQASCQAPVAAFATLQDDTLSLDALVAHPSGTPVIRDSQNGPVDSAADIGRQLGDRLLQHGARELLASIEADTGD